MASFSGATLLENPPITPGRIVDVPEYETVSWHRRLDETSTASATFAAGCNATLPKAWEHELVVYTDHEVLWAGPIVGVDDSTDGEVTVSARDLTAWWERWLIETDYTFTDDDLGAIFANLARDAAADTDVNMLIVGRDCGISGDRAYAAAAYDRVSDKLRELARTAVDYTAIGRRILIGGQAIPTAARFRLIDPLCVHVSRSTDGIGTYNDIVVVGSKATNDDATDIPVGRATSNTSRARLGKMQTRVSEPDIHDVPSANQAAATRLALAASTLPDLTVLLREGEYDLTQLVPGARVDVDLSADLIAEGQSGIYRLHAVDGQIDRDGSRVSIGLTGYGSGD